MLAPSVSLSEDQLEALDRIADWWASGRSQCFTLAGLAGTGKSTIIRSILDSPDMPGALVATPTGKAAQRLRELGTEATTIHRLAYTFRGYDKKKNPVFDFKGAPEIALVIVDEASMVDAEIYGDLTSSPSHRFLFVGDHGQLPPVRSDPKLMASPDFTLSNIHRQDDAGLLDFAHAVRIGKNPLNYPVSGAVERVSRIDLVEATRDADILICGRNATRNWLNHEMLRFYGGCDPDITYVPNDDDNRDDALYSAIDMNRPFPVLNLRNNYGLGIFNGEVFMFHAQRIDGDYVHGKLTTADGSVISIRSHIAGFRHEPRDLADVPYREVALDFGYCLTVHKAQGSEWDNVVVYDDRYSQGPPGGLRWSYTAATRAKEKLTWVIGWE